MAPAFKQIVDDKSATEDSATVIIGQTKAQVPIKTQPKSTKRPVVVEVSSMQTIHIDQNVDSNEKSGNTVMMIMIFWAFFSAREKRMKRERHC